MSITDQIKKHLEVKSPGYVKWLATIVAAEHTIDCKCLSCLIWLSIANYEPKFEDGEFGPFTMEDVNECRACFDLPPLT